MHATHKLASRRSFAMSGLFTLVLTAGNAVQGFKPVNKTEGRIYLSRPDVARAHGKTSWPSRGPPRGGWGAAVKEACTPGAQETAASNPGAQKAIAEAPAVNSCETLTTHMTFHRPVRALCVQGLYVLVR